MELKLPFMLSSSEQIGDALYQGVDEVSHDDSRGHNFGVRVLFLVEVPCASHPEELAIVARAVKYQDYDVQDLDTKGLLIKDIPNKD